MNRPKLAKNSKGFKDASNESPRLSNPNVKHIVQVDTVDPVKAAGSAIAGLTKMVMIFVMVVVLLYAAVTSTLMSVVPGNAGFTWLARATFIGGEPASGDYAYVSSQENPNNGFVSRLKQGVIALPDASVVQVIAGPAGDISNDAEGRIIYSGKPTNFVMPIEPQTLLGEYLTVCVTGSCTPGELMFISKQHVVGEAKGTVSLKGVEGYTSYDTPLAILDATAPAPVMPAEEG